MIYSDWDDRVKEEKLKTYYMGRIYAHGKLEKLLGYDLVTTDDKELGDLIKNPKEDKLTLLLEVEDNKKNIHQITVYLWKNNLTKYYMGLICLRTDEKSIKDAEKKYKEMQQII